MLSQLAMPLARSTTGILGSRTSTMSLRGLLLMQFWMDTMVCPLPLDKLRAKTFTLQRYA